MKEIMSHLNIPHLTIKVNNNSQLPITPDTQLASVMNDIMSVL